MLICKFWRIIIHIRLISNPSSSSIFFLPLLLLLLLLPPPSNGANPEYSACSTLYSCGRVKNIGYPFWGGDRPVICGVPNLKLNCLPGAEFPTVSVYNNGFLELQVESINSSSHIILISRDNLLQTCYVQDTSKFTFNPFLKPNPNYSEITLFYGCDKADNRCKSAIETRSKSFRCTNSDNTNGYVYYFDDGGRNSSCDCSNNVSVPVSATKVEEMRGGGGGVGGGRNVSLWNVLTNSAVEMVYSADFAECSKCEDSGGRCGSSRNKFVCHCVNGGQPLTCSQSSSGERRKLVLILGSVVGIIALIALFIYAIITCTTDKFTFIWSKTSEDQNVATFVRSYGSLAPTRYTYAKIRKMTNSFKDKLGEGGYGTVYKGKLHDGRAVAVKILKFVKGDNGKEFINEVVSISRTNHVNIVTLIGFCFEGNKRALVFEFLPNGSLEKFIDGGENSPSLKCETMFDIAVGIAKGLDYLHRGCNTQILHFDIKPHNILLDEDFRPKISDFGLARLCPPKYSMISMSVARGTIGYIAPEVFSRNFGPVSHKSDVYSYGMMLLDLVFGRKNIVFDTQSSSETYFLPERVYNQLELMDEVATHGVMSDIKQELERKMILVSLWCIQTYPTNRPPINKVVEMLEGSLESLQMPPKPHLCSPVRSVFDASLTSTCSF